MLKSRLTGISLPIDRPGFNLAELIIATALVGIVFVALLSLQTSVVASQQRQLSAHKLAGDAAYAAEALKRDIRSATVIAEPNIGASSSLLRGYINVNPSDQLTPVVASKPSGYFTYCVDEKKQVLYRYFWAFPIGRSFTGFACGNPSDPGRTREALITSSDGASLNYSFTIGAQTPNVVETSYWLISGKEDVRAVFSTQFQRGF